MSTTWLERLQADHGHRPRLYFTIQGIPDVFQEDVEDVPTALEASTRPRRKLIAQGGIKGPSPARLNREARRVEGGTLTLELMDDEDGTLAALFAPRRYRTTYVEADVAVADTGVDVKATTAISEGGHVYIGAETMKVNAKSSSALTNVTRGMYGSVATKHFGAAENGAAVFLSPPSWKGRRVYLTSYFLNDDGTTTADLSRSEGVFRIEHAPKQTGTRTWTIQCSELTDELYQKKIGRGLREVSIDPVNPTPSATDPGGWDIACSIEAAQQFALGDRATQVVMTNENGAYLCRELSDVDSLSISVTGPQLVTRIQNGGEGATVLTTLKHVAVIEDNWAQIILMLMCSRLGDGTNGGGFDALPGTERAHFAAPFFQMGAGIDAAEIDLAAFAAAGQDVMGSFVLDGEMSLGDAIFEFCLHTNSALYVTRAGLFSVRRLSVEANDAVMDVDESVILVDSKATVEYDEEAIKPRLDLLCNYDPLTGEYAGAVKTFDVELGDRYPGDDGELAISSRTIVIDGLPLGKSRIEGGEQAIARPTSTLGTVETMLRTIQVTNGRGRVFVGASTWHLDLLQLELGDLVSLGLEEPNLEGATSISQLARVIEIGVDWDRAEVQATFELVDQVYAIAPACLITSRSGGTLTLTTGTIEAGPDAATPGRMFAIGATVQTWDISAGTKETGVVVAVTDTTVEINPAPTLVVQAGIDLLRYGPQDDNAATPANDDGFDGLAFIYMMPDEENAAIVVEVTRLR